MIIDFLIFTIFIGFFLLFAFFLVRYSVKLGRIFGIGDFTLSFILLAFATSIPEIFISFSAGVRGLGEIAIGAAFGSTIINLTVITGMLAIFTHSIPVKNVYKKRQAILLGLISAFAIFSILDGEVDRIDGFMMIAGYFLYVFEIWFTRTKEKEKKVKLHYTEFLPVFIILLLCLIGLIFTSDLLVLSADQLSEKIGVSNFVFALIVLSSLTAIPELIYEFKNINSTRKITALGDLMGAVSTNITLVIGIAAIISPIIISISATLLIVIFFFAISVILFITFLFTREKLEWNEGIMLIIVYLVFLFLIFMSAVIAASS